MRSYGVLAGFLLALVMGIGWAGGMARQVLAPLAPLAAVPPITAYDLIAGVNGLRAARGLSQLKINASLMASAQGQADYEATIKLVTHTGPGGSAPIDRARAAGYGGGAHIAVAENIAAFSVNDANMVSEAIYQAWTDSSHMNTMVNPELQDAGAGIALEGGTVFVTLDTGWIAGSPLSTAAPAVSGTPPGQTPPVVIPLVALVTSTPLPDGSVYHVVGYGQVLINIATAYGVKVTDLVAMNRITPDQIYAGQKLLVRPSFTPGPPGQAALARPNPTGASKLASPTPDPPPTAAPATPTPPAAPTGLPPAAANPFQQFSPTQIGILATVACGLLALILVSLRKEK